MACSFINVLVCITFWKLSKGNSCKNVIDDAHVMFPKQQHIPIEFCYSDQITTAIHVNVNSKKGKEEKNGL